MVSFIIPTYNDTKNLEEIVQAIYEANFEKEIILIDDGSNSTHKKRLREIKGVKLITHEENLGKTAGMKNGILNSRGDIIVFIDADLVGLQTNNIELLVSPVVSGDYDITLSKKGSGFSKMGGYGFTQAFTGERAFRKKIIDDNMDIFDVVRGYEIESEMNKRFFDKCKIAVVEWKNVSNPSKIRHGISGVKSDMKMHNTIREYLGVEELTRQVNTARKLPKIKQPK